MGAVVKDTMATAQESSFMPVNDPTLVQAHVRDLIRSFENAKGSDEDQLATARSLYELAIFSQNRKITLEADGLSVVTELLRCGDEDVRAYALSTCAALAADGADACAALREISVHRKALELVGSQHPAVQCAAVNCIYWLAQDPESKCFLRDNNAETILSDLAVVSKDIVTSKLLNHAINSLLTTSKSCCELSSLVEQSSLTSSLRSARQGLLSGAASAAEKTTLAAAASLKHELSKSDPANTQAYYSVGEGQPDASEDPVGAETAPRAHVPKVVEEELSIDQVRVTFELSMPGQRGISKVLLSGNTRELGRWQPKDSMTMWQNARGNFQAEIVLPSWLREIEYKYAVVKGEHKDTVWESGFIRKFKLTSERMQQIEDTWEGVEGLEDFAPARGRAATEQIAAGAGGDDESQRGRSASSGGWRSNYRKM